MACLDCMSGNLVFLTYGSLPVLLRGCKVHVEEANAALQSALTHCSWHHPVGKASHEECQQAECRWHAKIKREGKVQNYLGGTFMGGEPAESAKSQEPHWSDEGD